jgi:non-heme chloroperoxidase
MPTITTKDGTELYYKDWGAGQPVTFSHGWPLSSDAWEAQMFFLASNGYRVIAHDRRGHGRSSQPWQGNDMDTYADDVAQLFERLDLRDAVMVGHSTGGGEVTRYLGRHGTARVRKAVLVGAVTPGLVAGGVPLSVFDGFRAAYLANRAEFFHGVAAGPFYNYNRPGVTPSPAMVQWWVNQGMACGHVNAYECIKAFSETDFTEDLKRIDIPVLVIHGEDDQVVPIDVTARRAVKLLRHGTLTTYPGGAHALGDTAKERLNADLLAFIRS